MSSRRTLLLVPLLAVAAATAAADTPTGALQQSENVASPTPGSNDPAAAPETQAGGALPPGDGVEGLWDNVKKVLHQLSGCTLASASITYALIAGVTFPGAGVIGLAGAGIVVLLCL